MASPKRATRCEWPGDGTDALMTAYHDREWGVPLYDDRTLFEFLILEGVQAGLSWRTVLHKRENYRAAYDGFDCTFPEAIESGGHYGSTLFEHVRFAKRVQGQQSDGASCAEGLWAIITAWMAQESIRTNTIVDVRETLSRLGLDPFGEGLIPDSNQRPPSDEANPS